MTEFYLGDPSQGERCARGMWPSETQIDLSARERMEEQADIEPEPQHSEDCALNCEHCHHGSDCYKTCCWCGGVRDGEGTVSMEFVECDCEVRNG